MEDFKRQRHVPLKSQFSYIFHSGRILRFLISAPAPLIGCLLPDPLLPKRPFFRGPPRSTGEGPDLVAPRPKVVERVVRLEFSVS